MINKLPPCILLASRANQHATTKLMCPFHILMPKKQMFHRTWYGQCNFCLQPNVCKALIFITETVNPLWHSPFLHPAVEISTASVSEGFYCAQVHDILNLTLGQLWVEQLSHPVTHNYQSKFQNQIFHLEKNKQSVAKQAVYLRSITVTEPTAWKQGHE